MFGTQELDDLLEPQLFSAHILVGLRPQRTKTALGEICQQWVIVSYAHHRCKM
jgi:hypothetical protein